MFPIPWNFPLRKKNGNLVNIGDAIEAGTEIPVHSASDAGKVLSVDTNGALEWSNEVPQAIQNLTDKLDDEVETRAELGTHNILYWSGSQQTIYNVTFTPQADNSIIISSEEGAAAYSEYIIYSRLSHKYYIPNGTYILSGGTTDVRVCVGYTHNGAYEQLAESYGAEVTFTVNGSDETPNGAYLSVFVATALDVAFNKTVYPMIRLAIDNDSTYRKGAMTNQELTEENQTLTNKVTDEITTRVKLGAHNILPLTLENLKAINASGVWSNNVYTYHDVTFTVDIDDKGAVTDIKVNGTNTASNTDLILCQGNLADFDGCLLSGCPSGLMGISINAELSISPWTSFAEDTGNGATIGSGIGANCIIFIRIKPNVAPSNKYFYPMIRLASDASTEYGPFAMTNRELTDKVAVKNITITPETGVTIDYNGSHKIGNLAILNFRFILDASFTVVDDIPIVRIDTPPLDTAIITEASAAWDGAAGGIVTILKSNSIIKLAAVGNFVAGRTYVVNVAYVCA